MEGKVYHCPLEAALNLIDGKWKCLIHWHLADGQLRFGELKRHLPNVTQKMLTQSLRELEQDGLLSRQAYAVIPPKVEYQLTALGRSLLPILTNLCDWGTNYLISQKQTAACLIDSSSNH